MEFSSGNSFEAAGQRYVKLCQLMERWGQNMNIGCYFCDEPRETREHLLFKCSYTKQLWSKLTRGVLKSSEEWAVIVSMLSHPVGTETTTFIVRYAFQASVHAIWSERNRRKHEEQPLLCNQLLQNVDIAIRNRLSTMRRPGVKRYEDGLRVWFGTRQFP